ncbi:DUF1349 domain-containing protein [Aureimonas ureilytica]|nr:DUF1349 domain-containing protein [Aureimonas ureilytica]
MNGLEMNGLDRGIWLNEPPAHALEHGVLDLTTGPSTDFWRETHYGFTRDSGHHLGLDTSDGFTAQVRVRARFESLYDQAGLMVRLDTERWVKFGVEVSDGQAMAGSVVTDGRSDWATGPFEGDASDVWLRVSLKAGVLRLQISPDGKRWPLLRLCPFPRAERYSIGPMACTPERGGLRVRFSHWSLQPHLGKDLHDLS